MALNLPKIKVLFGKIWPGEMTEEAKKNKKKKLFPVPTFGPPPCKSIF
jgi:hypothetical protein